MGHLTYLDGDPGVGKSLLALHLAACVSSGSAMPDGTPGKQGGVILIAPYDHASTTIKPRFEAASGDSSRVLLLNTVQHLDPHTEQSTARPFSLSTDFHHLETAIQRVNALLVLIDLPISIPSQETPSVLFSLALLAQRTGCAIVFIRPSHSRNPDTLLPRAASSRLLVAIARSVLLLIPDSTNEHHLLLLSTKHNLSQCPTTLTCRVTSSEQDIPTIHWLGASHTSVSTLHAQQLPLSRERQHILQVLQASPIPLGPQEIAVRTGQDYTTLRQTLHRMHAAQELISPARGLYTTPTHPTATIETVSQPSQIREISNDPSDLPLQTQSQESQPSQSSQTTDSSSDLFLQTQSQLSQTINPICDFPQPSSPLPPTANLGVQYVHG
ncbi:MAG: AAA family ATPase [Ktedonobacteraceae bacterium]